MSSAFPKESAEQNALTWANENKVPFTVYRDPSGNYLATKTSHFDNNRATIFSGHTAIKVVQPGSDQNAALDAAPETPEQQIAGGEQDETESTFVAKYFLCGNSDDQGKTFYGKPFVMSEQELSDEKAKWWKATKQECHIVVISECEINQHED